VSAAPPASGWSDPGAAPARASAGSRGSLGRFLVAPAMLWLAVFAIGPLLLLVIVSFWTASVFGLSTELSTKSYESLIAEPVYGRVLLQTLRIAVVTTLLALLVSYPLAMFLARLRGRRKTLAVVLLFLPFWTSYVVRTFVWLPMLGRSGLVNQVLIGLGVVDKPLDGLLYNEAAVYVGLVYVYTLYMTLPIYVSLDKLDPALVEASHDLGASPLQTFRRVIFPLTLPGVWSGCTMVFLLACGAYVTPQLLGGPSGQMFGNIIASQFLNANNWPLGAALSVVMMTVVLACLYLASRRFGLQRLLLGERG
jgi:spermidine/putrescine transport system permease protein